MSTGAIHRRGNRWGRWTRASVAVVTALLAAPLALTPAADAVAPAPATAAAVPTLKAAEVVLPPGEAPGPDLFVTQIECPVAGTCYAIGSYDNRGTGANKAFLDVLSHGRWDYVPIPLPTGVENSSGTALSCPQVGECVAVVQSGYNQPAGTPAAFALVLHDGVWKRRHLPPNVRWERVTCVAALQCVLYGRNDVTYSQQFAILDGPDTGRWQAAPIPRARHGVVLNQNLTCTSTAFCVDSGYVSTDDGAFAYAQVFTDGVPKVTALPVPADGTGSSTVESMTCSGAGSCFGFGPYTVADGTSGVNAVTLSGGHWTAHPVLLPTSVAHDVHGAPLRPISCSTPSTCAGLATPAAADGTTRGRLVASRDGVLSSYRFPRPAATSVSLNLVQCSVSGRCLATGSRFQVVNGLPTYQGFVGSLDDDGFTVQDIPGDPVTPDASTNAGTIGCAPNGRFCVIEGGIQGIRSFTGYFVIVRR